MTRPLFLIFKFVLYLFLYFVLKFETLYCSMVGARGFEPPTSCSQSRRATRLRYAPPILSGTRDLDIIFKFLWQVILKNHSIFSTIVKSE